uniref:Ionotropic glutamate receptor L-glutamate and glycine-binding domain-containing protein n=1 Tax=Timema genevievae TaxID=629358 RepID=A0A7R9K0I8_TIMGE|nr:unnamed protein product [Timema genevievae]
MIVEVSHDNAGRTQLTNMVVAKDKTFGRMTKNGSWNGIIGMLLREEVDMALTIMAWMSERAAILDYVTTVGEFRVFIRQPSSNLKWKYLGLPVDRKLWLASLSSIFLIVVLQLMTTSFFTRRHNDTTVADQYTLLDSLFIALSGFFCGQAYSTGRAKLFKHASTTGCIGARRTALHTLTSWSTAAEYTTIINTQPMTPSSCSLRVLLLTIYITGWLLMALYSGKITSSLAVRKVILPFNSMEGILADGSYQFTVLKNSAQFNILSKAQGGLEQQVFTHVMNQDLRHYPESSLEGLQQVCGEPRVAFLSLYELVNEYILELNCSIAMLPKVFFRNQMSFTSRRGSPYIRLFNYKILQLHSGGIMNKLRQDTWPEITHEKEDRPIPVELHTN